MSFKNGSLIGVDNNPSNLIASGVWDLKAASEAKFAGSWPEFTTLQLLETSSVSSSSDNAWRTGTYAFTSSSSISGTTGRFVVLHHSTTTYTADVQYDNIIIPTAGGNVTLDFETGNEACETTTVNVGTNIQAAIANAVFTSVATTTAHPSGQAGRWFRKNNGTGSSFTGNTMDGSGNSGGYSVYTETSGSHPLSMLLRTTEYTLASSGTISWREGYWGADLSNSVREVYWVA